MYQQHFGFKKPLFEDRIAQEGEIFIGAKQRAALANLKISLGTRDAVVVLTGPAGVGKTTLGSHALRTTTTRLALAWIGMAPLTAHELLEQLLTEFGFNPYKCSRVERLQMWRQFLNEMSMTETRVGILLDKTETFGIDVLQNLESLTAEAPNGCPGANVILTGGSALREVLQAPELECLRQRIRLSLTIDALSPDELQAFLEYKVGAAGGDAGALFAPGAIPMLQHYSQGCIRVVKNLCETALTMAAVRKEQQLTAKLIMQIAVGVLGMERPEPDAPPRIAQMEPQAPASTPNPTPEPTPASTPNPALPPTLPAEPTLAAASTSAAEPTPAATSTPAAEPTSAATPAPAATPNQATETTPAATPAPAAALFNAVVHAPAAESAPVPAPTPLPAPVTLDATNESEEEEDVPTLTDSVEIPDHALLEDVALSEQSCLESEPALEFVDMKSEDSDEVEEPVVEVEPDDPREETLRALANAKALEDISNSMAETLFGNEELEQLAATLAIAGADRTSTTDSASAPPPSPASGGSDEDTETEAETSATGIFSVSRLA